MDEFGFPIDSEYLENQSLFEENPEQTPKEVIVWTESDDDIRLWMRVFLDNEKYKFTYLPATKFQADGVVGNGCSRLIKLCDAGDIVPGKQNIVCIDSDFKFIAQISADYNGRDFNFPHFFWTLVHSKEHILLDHETMDGIVSHSSCTPIKQLKQHTMPIYREISKKVYPSLTCLIFMMSLSFDELTDKTEEFKVQFRDGLFTLLHTKKGLFNPASCKAWEAFSESMEKLAAQFEEHLRGEGKESNLVDFRERLNSIGITEDTVYLFIRGHDWEPVAKQLTKCHLDHLHDIKLAEIRASSKSVEQDIRALKNKTPLLDQALLSTIPTVENFPFFESTVVSARNTYSA
ncbi:DUF4435 domain-containing protein [Pseudomonas taiwanensis]|uniref:DUF4435 domain-containing protein n=1 Tax=Pseudomonas taiwanensis TaxID=470150 RepID=UPI001644200A|nr:DUF4435 domain-containing protein [Pseudomonas taiwanensis]MBC3493382.1 DUF4435 domain-containing protein [Pseudomonas taiwanensis]